MWGLGGFLEEAISQITRSGMELSRGRQGQKETMISAEGAACVSSVSHSKHGYSSGIIGSSLRLGLGRICHALSSGLWVTLGQRCQGPYPLLIEPDRTVG